MEVLVGRSSRRRASRFLAVILLVIAVAGVFAGMRKLGGGKPSPLPPLLATDTGVVPSQATGEDAASPAAAQGPGTRPAVPQTAPAEANLQAAAAIPEMSVSSHPLIDGRTRFEAGDLIAARTILNTAMHAGSLSAADIAAAKELLGRINQQAVFGRRLFKEDASCFGYTLQFGDHLRTIAINNNVTWELLCRINGISDPRKVRAFQTIKVIRGPFHAVISKRAFMLDIYLGSPGGTGSVFVTSFPVGLGKDDSTPTGTWKVQGKLKNPTYYSPRGEGVIAAGDPKNPLGAYWIGLSGVDGSAVGKMSYGIHGTIDPNSIGKEESMGCIRLRNEDVALVYELLVEGKSIVVVKD